MMDLEKRIEYLENLCQGLLITQSIIFEYLVKIGLDQNMILQQTSEQLNNSIAAHKTYQTLVDISSTLTNEKTK